MYEVRIQAVTNGYVVRVGCKTMVFNDRAKMLSELEFFLVDPEQAQKIYLENEKEFMPIDKSVQVPPANRGPQTYSMGVGQAEGR